MKGNGLFGAIRAFFVYSGDEAGTEVTGVARYLQDNMEPEVVEVIQAEVPTGVARYVHAVDQAIEEALEQEQESVAVDPDYSSEPEPDEPVQEVHQYVSATQESTSSNGIFGAIRSFFVYTDEAATSSQLTGVARYLQESTDPEPVAVAQSEEATDVARYLDESIAIEQDTIEVDTSIVEVEEEEVEMVAEQVVDDTETEQVNEILVTTATGVAKYMQEQSVIESELPLVTGVEMYLQDQEIAAIARSTSTGVGEYVDQANVQMEVAAIIAKYQQREVDVVEIEPLKVTGVASYIDNIVNSETQEGATGVVDYLDKSDKRAEAEVIIADYLARQQAMGETEVPAPSSVASYIEEREHEYTANKADSGVTAYLEKEAVDVDCADIVARFHERVRLVSEQQEALKPKGNRVSVVKIRHRQPSSVARYINELELGVATPAAALSGVDKFMMEQELAAKEQEAAEIIARFQTRQEELLEEPVVISGVASYIDKLVATEVAIGGESGVSRYLVNQPAITVEIPVLETESSVAKYVDAMVSDCEQPRVSTGVTQYVAKRLIEASQVPVETLSGVDRYVLTQS